MNTFSDASFKNTARPDARSDSQFQPITINTNNINNTIVPVESQNQQRYVLGQGQSYMDVDTGAGSCEPSDCQLTERETKLAHNPQKRMIEHIEDLPVTVQPAVSCCVCFTDAADDPDQSIPVYTLNNEDCSKNWHSICYPECIGNMQKTSNFKCPICRAGGNDYVPMMGWNKSLTVQKPVYIQPEFLTCPGCSLDIMTRDEVREHLRSCEKNKPQHEYNTAASRACFLNHLKKNNQPAGVVVELTEKAKPKVVLYENNAQGGLQRKSLDDTNQNILDQKLELHNTTIDRTHTVFWSFPGQDLPKAGVVQFNTPDSTAQNNRKPSVNTTQENKEPPKVSLQLREILSVTSSPRESTPREWQELKSMPADMKNLFTTALTSETCPGTYTHAITALQDSNDPFTLCFEVNQLAYNGFNEITGERDRKIKNAFLIYGTKLPGVDTHWAVQTIEPNKRIILEASKTHQLIALDSMSREEEADIHKATGKSVRDTRINAITYTLILATQMEKKNRPQNQLGPFGNFSFSNVQSGAGAFFGVQTSRSDQLCAFSAPQSTPSLTPSTRFFGFGSHCSSNTGANLFAMPYKDTNQSFGFSSLSHSNQTSESSTDFGRFGSNSNTGATLFGKASSATNQSSVFSSLSHSNQASESSTDFGRLESNSNTGATLFGKAFSTTNQSSGFSSLSHSNQTSESSTDFGRLESNSNTGANLFSKTNSGSQQSGFGFGLNTSSGGISVENSSQRQAGFNFSRNHTNNNLFGRPAAKELPKNPDSFALSFPPPQSAETLAPSTASGSDYDFTVPKSEHANQSLSISPQITSETAARPHRAATTASSHLSADTSRGAQASETNSGQQPPEENRSVPDDLSPELRRAMAFTCDATVKMFSDQCVPDQYWNTKNKLEPVRSLCPKSLTVLQAAFVVVDVLKTPYPLSDQEIPAGVLVEVAEQQRNIFNDQSSGATGNSLSGNTEVTTIE